MKQFKSWADVPVGTPFIPIKNSNSHNYELNKIYFKELDYEGEAGVVCNGKNNIGIKDVEVNIDIVKHFENTIKSLKDKLTSFELVYEEIKNNTDLKINDLKDLLLKKTIENESLTIDEKIKRINLINSKDFLIAFF